MGGAAVARHGKRIVSAPKSALDAALLAAHAAGDKKRIAQIYAKAADDMGAASAAFYLTHAYVFALDAGLPEAETYRRALVELGAEPTS